MPDTDPTVAPPLLASAAVPGASGRAVTSAWGLWFAVGWIVLLAAATLALATGPGALGEALDVGRGFR